tara:strand:- start:1979 stop:2794 length:816 start_codon:yes stop_codon:yes gene_type:complete
VFDPKELPDKDYKIFLGMPMYGGMLCEPTLHGLLELQAWTQVNNVSMRIQTMGNESLITRARNTIVSMMMDQTDFVATHLLFIDADIGFSYKNIERLLCADKDIACGIYPRKHIYFDKMKSILEDNPNATNDEIHAKALGYNVNFDDPTHLKGENGFFRVNEAATGMMLVKREVFRKMFKKFPDRKYQSDQIVNGKYYRSDNCYDLFAVGPYNTPINGEDNIRYLSEDYYFSRLWTEECNGEIWADLASPLTHFGSMGFRGHVGSLVAKKE